MNSRHSQFTHFYDDQVGAYRRVQPSDSIWNRLNEPTILVTTAVLLVAVVFKYYDLELSVDGFLHSATIHLWDLIVFVIPTPLLVAVDNRLNRSGSMPGNSSQAAPGTHAAKSELMKRVIGLDRSGGMMESVFQARSRALSVTGSVLGLKLDPERPAGLGNRDNSCYQNSILQGLASLPSFPGYLSACVRAIDQQRPNNDVAHTLRALIADLNDTSNNGRTIWTPSLLKSMSTWTQQDAQEYYSKVLDDIDRSVAKAVKSMRRYSGLEADHNKDDLPTTATATNTNTGTSEHSDDSGYQSFASSPDLTAKKSLRNPLEGLLAQRVACVQCGYSEGLSMIPFNCLTLSLGLDKNEHDLYERLDSYSKVEAIEGVECPKCTLLKAQRLLTKLIDRLQEGGSTPEQMQEPISRLEAVELALEEDHFDDKTVSEDCKISAQGKVNTTKTKQIVVARPPQSLAIHINRSVFDPRTFDMMKNSAPVSFPLTLDLGPWCLGSAEDIGEKPPGEGEEQWLLDAKSSMIAGDVSPSRLTGPIYELRAAVTHYGRHENGHYICYRKYPDAEVEESDATLSSSAIDDTIDVDETDSAGSYTGEKKQPVVSSHRRNHGWWRLSDHNVSKVDEDVIMSLAPGVFMLFYECVDPSMILQSEVENVVEDARRSVVPEELDEGDSGASTVSDESAPATVDTMDTVLPGVVRSAPSSVSSWTHDEEALQEEK